MERVAKNSDELLRMMEEDDLADQAEVAKRMTIGDYARLRRVTPQNVHYYIRNKKLTKSKCECGRAVIDVDEADIVFKFKEAPSVDHEAADSDSDSVFDVAGGEDGAEGHDD